MSFNAIHAAGVERAHAVGRGRRRSRLRAGLSRVLLIVICASVAFPFFWIAVNSLQPLALVLRTPPQFWPAQPQWHNYADAWHAEPFGQFYVNSIFVSAAILAGQVITCALAAYALSWIEMPLKGAVFFLILVALMVPEQLIIVPVFLELHAVNWINSYQALIVPFLTSAFGIFLLRQSFLRVPRALIEAARIDGATHPWVLLRIVAPLSLPGFITLIVLNFIWHYNDFFWPLIMTNTDQYRTLLVGLAMFIQSGEGLVPWNQLMAADIFSVVPLFVIFFIAQRYLVNGIVSGAVPDIAQMEVNSIGQFAASGALLPIDSLMKKSSTDSASAFLPGLLLSGHIDGAQYGLPFNRSVPVLYYNSAMLKAAGIAHPPTTWPELASDAKKLAHGSGSNKVYGFNPLADWWPWESYTLSAGGTFFNKDATQATFDSSTALQPMAIQQQLVKSGVAKINTGSTYWSQNIEDLAQGKTAMTLGSPADMATLNKDAVASVAKVWRTALMPTMPGHKLIVPPGGGNAVIFKKIP